MSKACKAVVHVSAYIHELEPTGELGAYVDPAITKSYGIKNFIIQLPPGTSDKCAEEIKELFTKIKALQE